MLEEAIYKFKTSGPMLLPDLIDNYWLGSINAYEDYAIRTLCLLLSCDRAYVQDKLQNRC